MTAPATATMRDVLIERIHARMPSDPSIYFLTADLGAPALDGMRREFPERCINVGIAEQNAIAVATGLALEGATVFAYGIAPFISMRAYEQIRTGLALLSPARAVNVNVLALGSGFSYDVSGPTHHCLEDLTLMRLLPNVELFSPSDGATVAEYVERAFAARRPKYLRLDGKPLPRIHAGGLDFERGFTAVRTGAGVCLVGTGFGTQQAVRIADALAADGVRVGVVDAYVLTGCDEGALAAVLGEYRHVFTIEEGFVHRGGLDALVAGVIERRELPARLRRYGASDRYRFENGGRELLHRAYGMDDATILRDVRERL